jgi:hypothetical protein
VATSSSLVCLFDCPGKIGWRAALAHVSHLQRSSASDDLTAFVARARSDINDPIAPRHHVHVVLHDDHSIAGGN